MALPPVFNRPEEYFEECLKFFEEFQHLYIFPNTDILVENVLDNIPIRGLENVDVLEAGFDLSKNLNNNYLRRFFSKIKRLKISYSDFEDENLELSIEAPLGPKKKHEIIYLAKEIDAICNETGCDTVVDFGSGLGYLDQQLFKVSNYKVLGLECNDNNYVAAKKRQRKYHLDSLDRVKFIKHKISEDSDSYLIDFIEDKFKSNEFCICGLHACGDLTVDAINLFLKMKHARAIVIMPCCYYKILQIDAGVFKNFPLSDSFKSTLTKCNAIINIPFLRLACQPPNISEEKMEDLVFYLLARATLQKYTHAHNLTIKRKKRKAVRCKVKDFSSYVKDATENGFSFISNVIGERTENESLYVNMDELKTYWRQNSSFTFQKAAVFISLQNNLQRVIENCILYDRLLYLKEKGIDNCEFKRIVSEKISPRCYALIAKK